MSERRCARCWKQRDEAAMRQVDNQEWYCSEQPACVPLALEELRNRRLAIEAMQQIYLVPIETWTPVPVEMAGRGARVMRCARCWDFGCRPLICRGSPDYCWACNCTPEVLDELLWSLFGWLWLLGGRTELETWADDEMRVAGVDDDELAAWCDGCGQVIVGDQWLVGLDGTLCDGCYRAGVES